MTTALLDATPRASYRARRQPDGSILVEDVPIFAEILEGEHPGRAARPRAWLATAVQRAQERKRLSGYLPPLHFRHHDGVSDVAPAGTFEPQRVGALAVNPGEPARPVVFAALRFKDEPTFRRWLDHYPNRSIEISSDHPEEINSLALLDSEAPLDRFPPTSRANVELASARRVLAQLWRHAAMTDEKKPGEDAEKKETAAAEAPAVHKEPDGDEKEPTLKEIMACMAAGFADLKSALVAPKMAAYATNVEPTPAAPAVMAAAPEKAAPDAAIVGRVAALEAFAAAVKKADDDEALRASAAKTWRENVGEIDAAAKAAIETVVKAGPAALETFAATAKAVRRGSAPALAAPAFPGYSKSAAALPPGLDRLPAKQREVFAAALADPKLSAAAHEALGFANRGYYATLSPEAVEVAIKTHAAQGAEKASV